MRDTIQFLILMHFTCIGDESNTQLMHMEIILGKIHISSGYDTYVCNPVILCARVLRSLTWKMMIIVVIVIVSTMHCNRLFHLSVKGSFTSVSL